MFYAALFILRILRILTLFTQFTRSSNLVTQFYAKPKSLRTFMQKGTILRKLYAELRKVNLLYAPFTQLYASLLTLRKAKTLYATLCIWQLADGGVGGSCDADDGRGTLTEVAPAPARLGRWSVV